MRSPGNLQIGYNTEQARKACDVGAPILKSKPLSCGKAFNGALKSGQIRYIRTGKELLAPDANTATGCGSPLRPWPHHPYCSSPRSQTRQNKKAAQGGLCWIANGALLPR